MSEAGKGEAAGIGYQTIISESKKKGALWEDPDFLAKDSSIYYENKPVSGKIEWKRPKDICSNPQFFVGGASRFDIQQGVLGKAM